MAPDDGLFGDLWGAVVVMAATAILSSSTTTAAALSGQSEDMSWGGDPQ